MVARRSNAKIPVSANKPSKSHTTKFIPSTRVEVNIIKAYSSKKTSNTSLVRILLKINRRKITEATWYSIEPNVERYPLKIEWDHNNIAMNTIIRYTKTIFWFKNFIDNSFKISSFLSIVVVAYDVGTTSFANPQNCSS